MILSQCISLERTQNCNNIANLCNDITKEKLSLFSEVYVKLDIWLNTMDFFGRGTAQLIVARDHNILKPQRAYTRQKDATVCCGRRLQSRKFIKQEDMIIIYVIEL